MTDPKTTTGIKSKEGPIPDEWFDGDLPPADMPSRYSDEARARMRKGAAEAAAKAKALRGG